MLMTTITRESLIKPGLFSIGVAADSRRMEFDFQNEELLLAGVRPDALFIGDSITHFWEVQAYFGGTGNILINRGIGGDISTYVRKRFAADALQLQPKLIVMKIGTNDLGWVGDELDDARIETVVENITAMAAESKAAGIPLALCSILPIWGPSVYLNEAATMRKNGQIVTANVRIRALAEAYGAIHVDYHPRLVGADGMLPRELADDGVHPHAAGYKIMARVLRETLAIHGITL